MRSEEEQAADDIISSLPGDSREILLLYYREGQRSQQVASLLGLSDAAVRKRLSRARATVREEMLQRFGEFARSSAPGVAFAATLGSALLVAAPGASAAAILGAGAVGTGAGKLGAGGLGASAVNGGVAFGALGTVFAQQWHIFLPAMFGGMLGAYLGGLCLLRFADSDEERRQIRRFTFLNTGTAALFCVGMLILVSLTQAPLALMVYAIAGMAVINYQCLVPLPRIMNPLLRRDAARRGRSATHWLYESMYGRSGVLIANLGVVAAFVWTWLR